jgi:Cu/Ag efflux pump CusA
MAWVIIGGLISSTLLARLVTPVMYKLLPPDIHGSETKVPMLVPNAQPV